MKNSIIQARARRKRKLQAHIKTLGVEKGFTRLNIQRSLQHIDVQLIDAVGGKVLAAASSKEKDLRSKAKTSKTEMAKEVGKLIASRIQSLKIKKIAVDRNGFKYHGRVAALVDAAREAGLEI